MAKKAKTQYVCTACGATTPQWSGQCMACKAWNTLEEALPEADTSKVNPRLAGYAGDSAARKVKSLGEVDISEEARTATGLSELDRVLGGGLVSGSVVLIGGDPGIGKSTLLLQTLGYLTGSHNTLYVTGEESLRQVSLRAHRLSLDCDRLSLLTETCVERVLDTARSLKPQIMVVDSIQTVYTEMLQSAPGAVAQLRESTALLVRYAKQTGTSLFLVGHVTKEGQLAGPRVLEHMVDTVLYFEGDQGSPYRVIRAVKNRFGAVNELGVFGMTEDGLKEVANPSAIFLSRHGDEVAGSLVMVTREGSRPLLVEVQALVDESHTANPRRVTIGLEQNRLAMLLAVMHRHGGIAMFDQDVFLNVVGGVRITETAADLPVLLSALSSFRDRALPRDLVVFGEVGLAGEIRPVPAGQDRLREAAKHGFKRAIVPKANAPREPLEGLEVTAVERLQEAVDAI